jgi:hypothetical protein
LICADICPDVRKEGSQWFAIMEVRPMLDEFHRADGASEMIV